MNKVLTGVLCIALVLLTLTVSIGLPIYIRPFYYIQIEELALPQRTGYEKEEIKAAYDEVMDYLTLPGKEFGTGVFAHSEKGAAHFADVKKLFNLNISVLLGSLFIVLLLSWFRKRGHFTPCRPFGKPYLLSCGLGMLLFLAVAGTMTAIDFETCFVLFHKLFFPGKDNWIFSSSKDPIIGAMPETFFLRCALLILGSVLLISFGMCLIGILQERKGKKEKAATTVDPIA